MKKQLRDNWVGVVLLVAVLVGLVFTWHNSREVESAQRKNAITQSQFNLRVCDKSNEIREADNDQTRQINLFTSKLFYVTGAAA